MHYVLKPDTAISTHNTPRSAATSSATARLEPLLAQRLPPFGLQMARADTSRRHVELAPPLFSATMYW